MEKVFELKVTLDETKPAVWRKLYVLPTTSLYELHHAIQLAFGWKNYHLYSFTYEEEIYGNPQLMDDMECLDDSNFEIGELFLQKGDTMQYEYDFGDGWMHTITLEKIIPNDAEIKSPVCMDGRMACPPEDCGGIPGYENLVEAMKSSKHPEYNELVEWLGKPFNPEAFNLVQVNKELKNLKKYISEYESGL